jgi:SEC-C motif-containing protein
MRCPCRKPTETRVYAQCCAPYHAGERVPATAVALMRSRYSAYALGDLDYVAATWHPRTRPADLTLVGMAPWIGLKIRDAEEKGDRATVSFTARWREGAQTGSLSETSRFVREDGRWFYLDGAVATD